MSATQTSTSHCQVLIIGAGPTGLVLAAQLLARGVRTRVIDKGEGPARQSRAISIYARTLELLDTMGLAETFIAHGHQVHRLHWYAGKRTLLNLDLARNGSRYGFVLHLPQNETERLLRARVRDLGGGIEQGVELVRLAQHGNAVDATLRDATGRDIELSAGCVVGCDGARSRVRHELGLAFEGQPYPHDWLLADVALDGAGRDDEAHMFFRPNGLPLVCAPMGGHRWRVVMPNAGDRAGRPPSFEEIQDLVEQRAPRRIVVSDPGWLSCFRCQLRSTTSYRRGRVLLAGDAAHVHSPAGGQGMNTGMMDAGNLAWKLALVTGGAPETLLDTYEQERVPVASSVLGFTDRLVGWATMRHPVKRALRDTLIPAATALPIVQNRAARRLSQMSGRMAFSPPGDPGGTPTRSSTTCGKSQQLTHHNRPTWHTSAESLDLTNALQATARPGASPQLQGAAPEFTDARVSDMMPAAADVAADASDTTGRFRSDHITGTSVAANERPGRLLDFRLTLHALNAAEADGSDARPYPDSRVAELDQRQQGTVCRPWAQGPGALRWAESGRDADTLGAPASSRGLCDRPAIWIPARQRIAMTAQPPDWDAVYAASTPPPWDIGRPQPAFVRLARSGLLCGRVLDVGCGTGEHALLAAAHGADAVGVDVSPRAIRQARGKAAARGVTARFEVVSALDLGQLAMIFDTVIDSGLFHVFDEEDRARYVTSLAPMLRSGGTCFLMCFSDRQPGDWGPRRVRQDELAAAFADGWDVTGIAADAFAINPGFGTPAAEAWLATIRRL